MASEISPALHHKCLHAKLGSIQWSPSGWRPVPSRAMHEPSSGGHIGQHGPGIGRTPSPQSRSSLGKQSTRLQSSVVDIGRAVVSRSSGGHIGQHGPGIGRTPSPQSRSSLGKQSTRLQSSVVDIGRAVVSGAQIAQHCPGIRTWPTPSGHCGERQNCCSLLMIPLSHECTVQGRRSRVHSAPSG